MQVNSFDTLVSTPQRLSLSPQGEQARIKREKHKDAFIKKQAGTGKLNKTALLSFLGLVSIFVLYLFDLRKRPNSQELAKDNSVLGELKDNIVMGLENIIQ